MASSIRPWREAGRASPFAARAALALAGVAQSSAGRAARALLARCSAQSFRAVSVLPQTAQPVKIAIKAVASRRSPVGPRVPRRARRRR